jgi:glutathione S-transferase
MAGGYKALGAMEKYLADGREWFVGSEPTLADLALYGYTHVAQEGGFEMERFPLTRGWLGRVAAMPGHMGIGE